MNTLQLKGNWNIMKGKMPGWQCCCDLEQLDSQRLPRFPAVLRVSQAAYLLKKAGVGVALLERERHRPAAS
jgi:hypothetical protein